MTSVNNRKEKNFTDRNKFNITSRFLVIVTVISFLGLMLSLIFFRVGVESVHKEHLRESITSSAKASLSYSNHLFNEMVGDLEVAANAINEYEDLHDPDVMKILKYASDTSKFSFIGVADTDGNGYDNNENSVSIADRDYFKTAVSGQVAFSEVMESKVFAGEMVQIIAHPIRAAGNTVRGVVFGVVHLDDIEILGLQSVDDLQKSVFIIDSRGTYIAQFRENEIGGVKENFWEDMNSSSLSEEEIAKIKSDLEVRRGGDFFYEYDGVERYACYMPIGPNKWQLVYSVSTSSMDDIVNEMYWLNMRESISVTVSYAVLLITIIYYFVKSNDETRKAHREASRNLEYVRIAVDHSKHIVFEYSLTNRTIQLKNNVRNELFNQPDSFVTTDSLISRKDIAPQSITALKKMFDEVKTVKNAKTDVLLIENGREIWFRISINNIYNDANQIIDTVGIVEDITAQKKSEAETIKRFQVQKTLISNALAYGVIDLYNGNIIEWNEEEVCIPYQETLSSNIQKYASIEYRTYMEQNLSLETLRKEYRQGKDSVEVQFLKHDGDKVRWVSIVVYRMYMDDTSKVLFVLTDIDEQKRNELMLKNQAERDGLTGLYNAVATRAKIDEILSQKHQSDDNQIFVLMDLDNYKQINDTFGHSYGDQVLIDIAKILKKRFRSSDIIGRIGGDEFVIFLRDVNSFDYAERMIDDLCKSIYRTYIDGQDEVTISASIGIASAPSDGNSFQELYEKSDIAQYQVKKSMKNGFRRYE